MASILHRARQTLGSLLPPPLRRAGAGLMLDLQSLPARVASRERWGDPWQTLHNVGGGDFREGGRVLLQTLVEQAGLTPEQRVLDIGCGTGRVALPLAAYLAPGAGYVGFDVSRSAVAGCRRRIARPDFAFHHADIGNSDYNAVGAVQAAAYRFPAEDGSVDLVFAFSVFTHMRLPDIAHYLTEARRVLKPGGRIAISVYLTQASRLTPEAGMRFQPWRDGAYVIDPAHPDRAIGFPTEALAAVVEAAGLALAGPPRLGAWAGDATYEGWQDLMVARRP